MPDIRRMGYLLILIVGVALALAAFWKPAPPPRFAGVTGADVPRALDGWRAAGDDPVPDDVRAALASASLLSRTYGRGNEAINFVLIGGTDRSALHDPRACLIGSGRQIEGEHLERLPGTDINALACRAAGLPGVPAADMLYFYVIGGRVVSRVTEIRAAMLGSALLGRRGPPVYFLRFTRRLGPDQQADARGHAHCEAFAAGMWKALSPKLRPAAQSLTAANN